MSSFKFLTAFLATISLVSSSLAEDPVPEFSAMIIFGDSSEDTGNWNQLARRIAPAFVNPGPHYFEGRFTNGPVWTEGLAELIGVPIPTASELDGEHNTNYSWGAATSGAVVRVGAVDDINEQLVKYSRDHIPAADELFVVSVGGNDIIASPSIQVGRVVDRLARHIEALQNLGAENFLVNTIRDLPGGNHSSKVRELNQAWRTRIPQLRDELDVNIFFSDFEQFLDAVVASPAEYGFTNVTEWACDCLNSDGSRKSNPTIAENPNEYLQWDGHLTAAGYELLGRYTLESFDVPGDLDSNGGIGVNDLDLLAAAIVSGESETAFDLNHDGIVNAEDHAFLVSDLARTTAGDTNLDGHVRFDDFLNLSANFNQPGGWNEGNFNLDRKVGFDDFLSLSANFGSSPAAVSSVPEPNGSFGLLIASLFWLAKRRRR